MDWIELADVTFQSTKKERVFILAQNFQTQSLSLEQFYRQKACHYKMDTEFFFMYSAQGKGRGVWCFKLCKGTETE